MPALFMNVIASARWLDRVPAELRPWLIYAAIILAALLVVRTVIRGMSRHLRRRNPPRIHPKLQKYNVDHAEAARELETRAAGIMATSTGTRLAGYRIVQQIEAVFVEGYRSPEEALTALKAAGADRGANALLNVRTDRSAIGKCSASADAVLVQPVAAATRKSQSPPQG